jgi:hypothetical protein
MTELDNPDKNVPEDNDPLAGASSIVRQVDALKKRVWRRNPPPTFAEISAVESELRALYPLCESVKDERVVRDTLEGVGRVASSARHREENRHPSKRNLLPSR